MQLLLSLPVRGAWIEIPASLARAAAGRSLPVRGAWIEIISAASYKIGALVAPRKGSVD